MARLLAEFQIEDGLPAFIESGGRRHYRVRLYLEEVPEDAITITYELDETYSRPFRVVASVGATDFAEFITAYGDFPIRVTCRTRENPDEPRSLTRDSLVAALRRRYDGKLEPPVSDAIDELAAN